jgi:hypothetical protein
VYKLIFDIIEPEGGPKNRYLVPYDGINGNVLTAMNDQVINIY